MIPALEAWLSSVVLPEAQARFGQKVAAVDVFGAYSCRSIDNIEGVQLSEHAFGNAVDVSGFTLADGRRLEFVRDWKRADSQEASFLHAAHAGACRYFTTVLGPGADMFHYNHIHLDLANHGATDTGSRRICKPRPTPNLAPPPAGPDGLPPSPEIEQPLDISRLGEKSAVALAPVSLAPGAGPDAALPPAAVGRADPAPPMLPAGAGPGVDAEVTSSLGDRDE